VALAFIAVATLTPTPEARPVLGSAFCLLCGEYGGVDFLLNVLLFVPLGLGLRLAGVSGRGAVLAALVATVTIEALQLQIVAGRDASLGDLLSNTAGGALGALLAVRWRALLLPRGRAAARLAWAAPALWAALAAGTALSATLWGPDGGLLYRRSAPTRRWAWFPGQVLWVQTGAAAVTRDSGDGDGRFAVLATVPRGGPVRVGAGVVSGGPSTAAAAIAIVRRPGAYDVVALAQNRRDLTFHVRTAAAFALVRVPGIAVENVFAPRDERARRAGWPVAGDTLRIAGDYTRRRLRVDVWWRGGHTASTALLHPFVAWSYFLPWEYSYGRWADVLSALWAGGLIAPAAYWATRAARPGWRVRRAAPVALAAAVGLAAVPAATGVSVPPAVVWAGVALGAATGAALGRWSVAADRAGTRER
jgi:hypothetical protein